MVRKWGKYITLVLTMTMLFNLMLTSSEQILSSATPEPATNFNYSQTGSEINITGYWPKDANGNPANSTTLQQVEIPSTINGMPVVSINQAFYYKSTATQGSTGYTLSQSASFILPDSVRTITAYSFRNQSKITSIDLPTGLTSLATSTFMDCAALTSIKFKSLTAPTLTGAPANKALTVYYPSGGTGYNSTWQSYFYAGTTFVAVDTEEPATNFNYSQASNETTIKGYWPKDGSGNPANNTNLTKVVMPSSINNMPVVSINQAFYYKSTATQGTDGYTLSQSASFIIPDSVRTITAYSFRNQSKMTSIDLPTGLTSLATSTFMDCSALTSINFKGMTAPTITGAPANKALTVYYPAGGTGYNSTWQSYFYAGTTFVAVVGGNPSPSPTPTPTPSPTPTPTPSPTPTPTPTPTPYDWVNPANYPVNKISVVQPAYTSNISGNTEIVLCAQGFTQLTVKCWKQGTGYGTNSTVATVNLDSRGVGGFIFPAGSYPHGPLSIIITGTAGTLTDECDLQVYNTSGVSWNEGLSNAPTPPQISGLGLSVVYSDDFTNSNLSINKTSTTTKYTSHTFGYKDFSGIKFRDYEDPTYNPFSQVDTYMRIRADQTLNSSGLISSLHQDGSGFAVKAPAYFECKFAAQNAEGTWPAFWTLTNPTNSQFTNGIADELDVIEAYGFDKSQSSYGNSQRYTAGTHNWGQTPNDHLYTWVYMRNFGGTGLWYEGFHTYGVLVSGSDIVFYLDNVEVRRQPMMTVSAVDYMYFLINYAVGGTSGWPYDLSRYNNKSDMYVDWVRVYGLSQNVQ